MSTVTLIPGTWVRVPGTGVQLRWDGDDPMTISSLAGGFWDLSPLAATGRVLVWCALVNRPELGSWPVLPSPNGRGAYFRPSRPGLA